MSGSLLTSWIALRLLESMGFFQEPYRSGQVYPKGLFLVPRCFKSTSMICVQICPRGHSYSLTIAPCWWVSPANGTVDNARTILQHDLDSCCEWADINQMSFAAHKTQVITFSRKQDARSRQVVPLRMRGTELEEVKSIKLLGVTFGDDGSNKIHLKEKVGTTGKMLGLLRRQAPFLSESARYHVWIACMRPVLEYCSPILTGVPSGLLESLERVQNRAARLFPSKAHLLDPISLRREVAGLSQLHRIVHGTAPPLVRGAIQPVPFTNQRTTRGSESRMGSLATPFSRTEAHRQSFLPHYIRSWNCLPDEQTFNMNLSSFKHEISKWLRGSRMAIAFPCV